MKKTILVLSICSIFITSCDSDLSVQSNYHQPKKVDDGFKVGTLADVNLDETSLQKAVDDIQSGKYGEIHSMLIFKDDKLVFEKYFVGHDYKWDGPNFHGAWVNWDINRRHNIHSVGKSITSACIGIAIKQGLIKSVDQSIFDYLPEYQHLNTAGKNQIKSPSNICSP